MRGGPTQTDQDGRSFGLVSRSHAPVSATVRNSVPVPFTHSLRPTQEIVSAFLRKYLQGKCNGSEKSRLVRSPKAWRRSSISRCSGDPRGSSCLEGRAPNPNLNESRQDSVEICAKVAEAARVAEAHNSNFGLLSLAAITVTTCASRTTHFILIGALNALCSAPFRGYMLSQCHNQIILEPSLLGLAAK